MASLNETSKQAMLGLLPAEHAAEPGFAQASRYRRCLRPRRRSWSTWGAFPSAFPLRLPLAARHPLVGRCARARARGRPSAAPIFQRERLSRQRAARRDG